MVTLAPFLRGSRSVKEDALNRAISILLKGIGRHAARFGVNDADEFETSVELLREELGKTKDPDGALVIAGSAVQALEEYSDASMRRLEESQQGWREIVRVLLEFVDQSGFAPKEGAGALGLLEKDLQWAARAEDTHALRARVEEYLSELAERAAGPGTSTADLNRLSNRIYANAAPEEADPATGLPGPRVATEAVAAVWGRKDNRFLVAFVLERLEAINIRFGCHAGDQIIQNYSQSLAQSLGSSDQLFRWSGPCLLALIEREMPEGLVAAEMARTSAVRLEETIVVRDREVIVPVSPTWSIFALEEYEEPEAVCRKVEEFVDGTAAGVFWSADRPAVSR